MQLIRFFAFPLSVSLIALLTLSIFRQSWLVIYLVLVLSLLEITLSFDNAVVNAKVLETMSPRWRKNFLLWGIIIAVFVMRLICPLLLVYFTTPLSVSKVIFTAVHEPALYHAALLQGYPLIAAFGGAFLWSVFLGFLLDREREVIWFASFENNPLVRWLKQSSGSGMALSLVIGLGLACYLDSLSIGLAFLIGVGLQVALSALNQLFSTKPRFSFGLSSGLISFIYLEILDASFSFDGVVGAFAISTDIVIILAGLGIGALFVRSFTVLLVEKQVLKTFRYLDHGAHYAIGFLALVMFVELFYPVPSLVPGTVSIVLVISAAIASQRANHKK